MHPNTSQQWDRFLQFLKDNLSTEQYNAWFKPLSLESFDEGTPSTLTLRVPSPFFAEYLEQHFLSLIAAAINKVFGRGVELYYKYDQVSNEPSTNVTMKSERPSPAVKPQADPYVNPFRQEQVGDIDSQLNPTYTFENYCASASNMVARSIGESIADNPKCKTYNPLFIYGPTGVGKTHLIQAIGIRIKERNPRARVLYITARLFESQFTTATFKGKINDFINFYQSIDVLIIDDIQDLIGKAATQNTFFHIFNHLHQNQKQLILSSDCCPSQMEGMEARMLSRFKWGATVELSRPDYELRKDVLSQKASHDGLQLPPEVMEFIAANVTDSIRELEGIVVSLLAHATFLNREITVDLARTVLSNAVRINKKAVNFEMIARQVSEFYNIDPDQIFAKSRKREISDARQMVMYLAKKHTKMPLKAIGSRLARTHATVLHAIKNIDERLTLEKQLREDLDKIESQLVKM